jgi:hypothetical protein
MATNVPPDSNPTDPDPDAGTIPPAESLEITDDELILEDEGVNPPPAEDVPALQATNFDMSLSPPSTADPEFAVGEPIAPTGPATGWYESSSLPPTSVPPPDHPPPQSSVDISYDWLSPPQARSVQTSSTADIDLPPVPHLEEDPSDIFTRAKPPVGSDVLGTGGSDVLADPSQLAGGSGSDLFAMLPLAAPAGSDRGMGSSLFEQPAVDGGSGSEILDEASATTTESTVFEKPTDDSEEIDIGGDPQSGDPGLTERHASDDDWENEVTRTEHNIALPTENDTGRVSGFDQLQQGESDSDLFGDATIVDMSLVPDAADSAIDLHDPKPPADDDEAGLSSIFSGGDEPAITEQTDADVSASPRATLPGSPSTFGTIEPPAPSSIFSGIEELDDLPGSGIDHSSAFALGQPGTTDELKARDLEKLTEPTRDPSDLMDATLAVRPDAADPTATDVADDEILTSTRTPRAADDESVFSLPTIQPPQGLSNEIERVVAAATATPTKSSKPAGVSLASKRPPAEKPITLPERRKGGGILVGALGVVIGAGLGAAGMYGMVGGTSSSETPRPVPPPAVATLVGPTAADLASLENAKKQAEDTLAKQQAELEKAKEQVARLAADLNTTRTTATKLSTENKSLNEQQKKAEAEAQAARKELQAKVKEVEAAQTLLSNTEAKFKAATDVVAGVVAKLQEAKLIDPQVEPEAALKSLPDVLKKAVVLNKEPKLEELAAAVEKAELARNEAEQRVKKAESELAAVRAEAAKQVAAEVKKAIEATQAELARVKAERAAEVKRFQERLAAQEQQYQSQLTAARAGASVPFTSLERAAQDRARRAYASGLEAWRARQYETAEAWFTQATKDDPADARYWYFAGLAKWAQGKQAEARKDFETGAEWEARSRPGRRQVGEALLLVQGPARAALDTYRP